jgi:hypothetical protein
MTQDLRPNMPARRVVYHPDTDSTFVARVNETLPILAKATNEELEPIITILRHTTNPEATVVMSPHRIDVFRDLAAYQAHHAN